VLLVLLLVTAIAITTPAVQTYLAKEVTTRLNKEFKTNITVNQVAITVFGVVKLKKVIILDHHKDTLIYAKRINTNILDFKKIIDGDLIFGSLRLDGLVFNMKQYKGEKDNNLDKFIAAFDTGKPSTKKFLMKVENVSITNGRYILSDENQENPKDLDVKNLNTEFSDFQIFGPEVTTKIDKMNFLDHSGLEVKNLAAKFTYTKKNIILDNLDLTTNESLIKGKVVLSYDRKDFVDFNNKVRFDIRLDEAKIATNDIRNFYNELGKDQIYNLQAEISGTLNDLQAKNLKLIDNRNSQIIGDVNFKNLFGKKGQEFYMKGSFDKVASSYENLTQTLPNVLGKKLPSSLKKLGQFVLNGDAEITTKTIDADFYLKTILGNIKSKLYMSNIDNIDNAKYKGNIVLDNFNIGSFLNRKDVEKVSLDVDVDGKGFTEKYLDTKFSGDIFKIKYNKYDYSKIIVDGMFKSPIFKGKVYINDPNLFMDFDGLVNFNKKDISYDFQTKVDYANLVKLNFMQDSTAVFKGDVAMKVSGTNLDNLQGNIYIKETSFQNNKEKFNFDDFTINSSFDANRVRTITVNSPDIIDGKVVGKFQVNQLQKMVENSFGSLYTNYNPNKIKPEQFLKFDITINNKIVELFYPQVSIGTNTNFKGLINSDNDEFKLDFKAPNVKVFDNEFDNIQVAIDNKNPLFNTYITLDSIKTKQYKVRDFSLINVTTKDTLFLRSEFKGGPKGKDFYNLNLFHTINRDKNNVVGIQKSEMMFKDYLWFLNEKELKNNTVTFDKNFKNFNIDNIIMSHENQKIELSGLLNGNDNKDLKLNFDNVEIDKILPVVDKFQFEGNLSGLVNLKQVDKIYQPTSSLKIQDLKLNKIELGNLILDIEGDNSFKKFVLNSSIENKNVESFSAKGDIAITDKKADLNLNLNFEDFNLGVLSSLGGDVLSNIRGFASGKASITGNSNDPDINGRLFLNNAGMGIPYLNIDYKIENQSIVDVTKSKFLFRKATLTDSKFNTQGSVLGVIEHKNFGDWKLDLNINSKRLVALDTKDTEDAAYYGVAFINGSATIKGPTNALVITVNAKSDKGTAIKIPINDSQATSTHNYIHFVTKEEKYNITSTTKTQNRNYNGLELEFELDITPDAEIEVILDRNSGHGMKGKGYGSLLFKINTLGKFNMWGDFQAYEGTYNFKYGGIINKKFEVKKGGSISWEGDPMRAILNLEAVYKTIANPATLVENPAYNKKVDVEVIIGIKGNLSNPEPDFNINFPTMSSVFKSEIQTKLDDKDTRQKQAIFLLSTGSLLSDVGVDQATIGKDILYDKVSDIFGNIFSGNDKIGVGIDIKAANTKLGSESDGRVGLSFNYKISDRITFNGKAGIPVGGINQSAIVGNAEIQYRVNQDGTMNLRFFNKENDINYIGQGIGYTQGVGISYDVDFDTFQELLNRFFKTKEKEEKKKQDPEQPDSDMLPDYINFSDNPKKKKEATEIKKENPPHED
jgi:hypothetical protein